MPADKELMGASTALVVLGCLQNGPSYGYELLRRINTEAAGLFAWREGTLYPVLHRLEHEGLLRAQWQDSESAKVPGEGRPRKYYYITAKGRKHLANSARQWQAFHALITRLAGSVPPDTSTGRNPRTLEQV